MRAIATESGTTRLAVRVRPTNDPHQIVVAFPWRHRNRAQVMAAAVAEVLDALPGGDVDAVVSGRPRAVAARRARRRTDHDHARGSRWSR